ncbi:MFS transporter [Actinoplanes derwentensis]|uniref:Predicted arabinose efflux permease, MFS family n=1 Tax=Actinoplanes derwentensis TaxID=113562 RepID=A0A1H2CHZ5_9ACTN|nr:MFS transporter [Actinoplanes derwentensis]SDT70118.1 Predicted arabinose efflux permease, MFS family [Actinoplanes derwentensis]
MTGTGAKTTGPVLGPTFAKFWTAATASALGSGLVTIAAPLYVASRTNDPVIVSAVSAIIWVPWLLFTLPGGILVDRVDRRRLMIGLDWARFVVMAALGVAILFGHAPLWLLFVTLFLIHTGEVLFETASQAMIPAVVPKDLLEKANGWLMGGTITTKDMIAGPLGAFLFVVAVSIPFLVNAGMYVISAVFITLVPGVFRIAAGPAAVDVTAGAAAESGTTGSALKQGLVTARSDIAEAFRFLMGQPILRTMSLLIGVLNITLTAGGAVLVLLAKERLHLGSVGYGLLFSSIAVGGVVGSAFGDRIIKRVTSTWTVRGGLLVEAAMYLALAASGNPYLACFALFLFGVHTALWYIVAGSLRHRLTPPEMMGRVSSLHLFIVFGGNAVGALLGGVLAKQFGLTAPYWLGFAVALAVTAVTWRIFNRDAMTKVSETANSGQ